MLSNDPGRLREIVITGGNAAGWMAATALARATAHAPTRITLIDDGLPDPRAVVAGPALKDFHVLAGIDEHAMLAAAAGTMRLATEIVDPAVPAGGFIHAFGDFGLDVANVPVFQLWLRARASGHNVNLDDFNLAAVAARLGRFGRPAADKRAMIDHGYQLDGGLYTIYLRQLAEAQGVVRIAGHRGRLDIDPLSGSACAARLDDGRSIAGDFFIDCSADLDAPPGSASEDLRSQFPCWRTVEVATARSSALEPMDRVVASGPGWLHTIRQQHQTSHRLSYMDGVDGEAALLARVEIEAPGSARHRAWLPQQRRQCWSANSVALGPAAFSIDEIAASELDVAAAGIMALIALLPDRGDCRAEASIFNRQMKILFDAYRDMAILYRLVVAAGSPSIRGLSESGPIPAGLLERIDLFTGRGRISTATAAGYSPAYWLAALRGRGLHPASWEMRADAVTPAQAAEAFSRLSGLFRQSAESMPRHSDYIARHCAATKRL